MKGWVMRKFLVSKLKYNVIEKYEYFNVAGGGGVLVLLFWCSCNGAV